MSKFFEYYWTFSEPPCNNCVYFHRNTLTEVTCMAFPKGIPDVILDCENDHTEPLPGQGNRIVFRRIKYTEKGI